MTKLGLKIDLYFFAGIVLCIFLIWFSFLVKSNKWDCEYKNRINGYTFYFLFSDKNNWLLDKLNIKRPQEDIGEKCFYEFYESIENATIITGNNYDRLKQICTHINLSFPIKTWDLCYFKVGIASTYSQRQKIEKPEKLQKYIDSKIKFCEGMGKNTIDCIIGIYTGVGLSFQNFNNDSKFPIKDNNPFWLCGMGLGQKYELQCYRNLVSVLYDFAGKDLDRAVDIIHSKLDDETERFEIDLTFYSSLAYIPQYSTYDIQKICSEIKDAKKKNACIQGYATGLDEVLPQGTEGAGVVDFCVSPLFSYREVGECLRRGFFELPGYSNFQERNNVCKNMVPKIYKDFCVEEVDIPVSSYVN